jgi:excinuclease ABC subunit C
MLNDKLQNIPQSSGCYLFKNEKEQIIYVGKSKFLPKRVKSYFQKNHEDTKTKSLVKEIVDVDFMVTNDETQALILEDELIKSYKPKYNIKSKDDKSRKWFICLTKENFPRLIVCNKTNLNGDILLTTTSSNVCYEICEKVLDIINLRTCSYDLTKENIESEKFKPCLEYHIMKCDAPCIVYELILNYKKNISFVKNIFSFDYSSLERKLNREMNQFSKIQEFEKAQMVKLKLDCLQSLISQLEPYRVRKYNDVARTFKQQMNLVNIPTLIEAFDNSHTNGDCQVSALVRYKNGKEDKTNYRKFNINSTDKADDYQSFTEVLSRRFKRLLNEKKELPSLVIIDGGKGQLSTSKKVFEELGLLGRIDLISISKDDNHKSQTIHTVDGLSHSLPKSEMGFLLGQIQEEVHRFVISFHRKKRTKKMFN